MIKGQGLYLEDVICMIEERDLYGLGDVTWKLMFVC